MVADAALLIMAGILYISRIRMGFNLLVQLADSVNQVFWIADRRRR